LNVLSQRLSCLLLAVMSLMVSARAQDATVPAKYRSFFHLYQERSIPEKVLNLIGLRTSDVGRSFALLAGVSHYPNFKPPDDSYLRPAAVDLQNLENYLKNQEFFSEIVALKDADMTYENLQYFLQVYFPQRLRASPHSRFLFAYSGHGITDETSSYLLQSSAKDLHDASAALDLNVVHALVQHVVRSGYQVLVLLNTCYGGAFLKLSFTPTRPIPRNPGAHAITAGGSRERSWQDPSVGDGSLFFETLFKGLGGPADTAGDGVITYDELSAFLKKQIQGFTDQRQNPQSGYLIQDDEHIGSFFFLNRGRLIQSNLVQPWNPTHAVPFGPESKPQADDLFVQGREFYEAKDYNAAIASLTQAIAARGDWADAFNLRAASYDALNQPDKAFADYDQAVALSPNWSSPMFYRGRISEQRQKLKAALADYEHACTLSPGWQSACLAAAFAGGRIASEAKDYTTAIAKLTQAIKIQGGDSADLFNLRAASYDALNQIDEAFADYDRAVKLSPNWSSPMFYRGRIYEKRGNRQAALADYERACTLSPEWPSPCDSRDRLRR